MSTWSGNLGRAIARAAAFAAASRIKERAAELEAAARRPIARVELKLVAPEPRDT